MAFPKDLRQRMINLMYLVLMAMLAINIDPSALKAFKNINEGMKTSFGAFSSKNSASSNAIKTKADEEKEDFMVDYSNRAAKVNALAADFQKYIDNLITEVRSNATNAKGEYFDKDKDASQVVMITDDPKTGGAAKLKGRINELIEEYKKTVRGAEFFKDEEIEELFKGFALKAAPDGVIDDEDNVEKLNWEEWNFSGKPAIALEAILRQIKNDATATEGQILDEFRTRLDIGKIDYDVFQAAVIPSSTYLQQGDAFSADIFLASTSSKSQGLIKVYANGQPLTVDADGKATYTARNGVGEHTLTGYIVHTNPTTGKETKVEMKPVKYSVAAPSATVSADKMNVLYIGVDNPLSVSAAGIPLKDVSASCPGCGLKKSGPGKYIARPTKQGKVTVSITANGKTMGTQEFRIKRIPDPVPMIGTKRNGQPISTGELGAQTYLRAVLDGFDFDAKFNVLSYDMMLAAPGKASVRHRANGPNFTAEMKRDIGRVRPGWFIVCYNIKAKGPDGSTRNLGSVVYPIR